MKTDIVKAKELLEKEGFTCVVCGNSQTYTSKLRGVKPLVLWYGEKTDFKNFSAADKVIGRATAFLYVLLGVKAVYAKVISRLALEIFEKYGITVEFEELVPNIINRKGDGICPFEEAVSETLNPLIAYEIISKKMKEMNI